jgi:hypothetical protein
MVPERDGDAVVAEAGRGISHGLLRAEIVNKHLQKFA